MSQKRGKECKCSMHSSLVDAGESPKIMNLESGKKVKVSTKEILIRNNAIGPKCKYVCEKCIDHFESNFSTKKAKNDDFQILINDIIANNLPAEDIESISYAIGTNIAKYQNKPDVQYGQKLEDCDFNSEIAKYDNKLVCFLKEFCNMSQCSEAKLLLVLEHLYSLTDNNFVGPLSFSTNVLSYYFTGSRNIVDLNNKLSPSGSYYTLSSFLEDSSDECVSIPDGDGVFFFDNNQILSKRWNIVYNCKASLSAVTTLLFLVPPIESHLQKNPSLSPYIWLTDTGEKRCEIDEQLLENIFRNYRNDFINSLLQEVYKDQSSDNGVYRDKVDIIEPGEKYHVSTVHHRVATATSDGGVSFKPVHNDPYSDIASHVEGKCETSLLDPIFVNPCSYSAVSKVFDDVLEINRGKREWVAMGCDGLPYILGSKIIEKNYICSSCAREMKSKEEFLIHTEIHNDDIDINYCKKYGKILLVPGLGHYEINYTKAMFKLLWTVCLCTLAKMMGFKSMKALQNCQKALNHHKSWQLLNILLHANSRELVLPFVRHCLSINVVPSLQSFYQYIEGCGPNYVFLFKCTFTFLLALKLFRSGVRRCNHEAIKSGMHKLSSLFYGLNMTTYMEIDIRRTILEDKCPGDVKSLYLQLMCMSRSGNPSKAEGGDFILEAFNRKVKMFMPPGPATSKRWLRAYRNLPLLEKMKQNTSIHAFKDDPEYEGFRKTSNETEIIQWRKNIRSSGYLSDIGIHKSMEGEELDTDLVNFDEKCRKNRNSYCQAFPAYYKCEKVFITPEDRSKYHDIRSKTKKDIAAEIQNVIESVREYDNGDILENLITTWEKCKKGKKADYLEFYKEVTQALEEVTAIEEENECGGILERGELDVVLEEEEEETKMQTGSQ